MEIWRKWNKKYWEGRRSYATVDVRTLTVTLHVNPSQRLDMFILPQTSNFSQRLSAVLSAGRASWWCMWAKLNLLCARSRHTDQFDLDALHTQGLFPLALVSMEDMFFAL